jgi:hypothetical protein
MTVYLIGLLVVVGLVGREAWLDRTPRAALPWWAHRRTKAERQSERIRVRSRKAA